MSPLAKHGHCTGARDTQLSFLQWPAFRELSCTRFGQQSDETERRYSKLPYNVSVSADFSSYKDKTFSGETKKLVFLISSEQAEINKRIL